TTWRTESEVCAIDQTGNRTTAHVSTDLIMLRGWKFFRRCWISLAGYRMGISFAIIDLEDPSEHVLEPVVSGETRESLLSISGGLDG
ncbi:MAG: hypothetical protein ACK46C_11855, partial [Flavobacteriales bacterium]